MSKQEENWLLQEKYQGNATASFYSDCKLLEDGVPLAYIIGYIPFLDTKIFLDSKPLIPRTETEFWVNLAREKLETKHQNKPLEILDLCAGSGCVGVALAKNKPQFSVDFSELDQMHEETIKKNCFYNDIKPRQFQVFIGDLFLPLPYGKKYNYIFSNPPYIDKELNRTALSVQKNEPALALYGGKKGLEIITKIIKQAKKFLKPEGELWIEHEPEQVEAINTLALEDGFSISNHKDQYKLVRWSILNVKIEDK